MRPRGNPGALRTIPCVMPLDPQRALKPLRKAHKALNHPSRHLTPEGVHDLRTQCYRIKSMIEITGRANSRTAYELLAAHKSAR